MRGCCYNWFSIIIHDEVPRSLLFRKKQETIISKMSYLKTQSVFTYLGRVYGHMLCSRFSLKLYNQVWLTVKCHLANVFSAIIGLAVLTSYPQSIYSQKWHFWKQIDNIIIYISLIIDISLLSQSFVSWNFSFLN